MAVTPNSPRNAGKSPMKHPGQAPPSIPPNIPIIEADPSFVVTFLRVFNLLIDKTTVVETNKGIIMKLKSRKNIKNPSLKDVKRVGKLTYVLLISELIVR